MDPWVLFKIAGIGFVVMILATMLKQAGRDDQGQLVSLVGVLLVLTLVVKLVYELIQSARSAFLNG